ncbi:response regulator [Alsobacter metallidurans]|uniref:Response regulator n=1 Tax=Alsobacter metallidurans TaxID=340221 RepID=A0A917IC98_9HYPH|nr:response regulator [Alsobacter metallidurans]GGH32249.1 response regulator [Alsobacter metallidurans]
MQGSRILIVEDEMLVAMMIEDMITDMGLIPAGVAGRLQQGVDLAGRLDLDGAVLDVNLDGEQSFPVARVLQGRSIPFFFATGYGAKGIADEFKQSLVLQKPFNAAELESAFRRILR